MDKQTLIEKTTETLRPLETDNLINTIQTLTLKQIFTHPAVLIAILALLFFGIYKKSTTVLLTLFLMVGMIVITRYAMPAPGEELTMSSIVPFIGIGVVVGGIIIYVLFVKSD